MQKIIAITCIFFLFSAANLATAKPSSTHKYLEDDFVKEKFIKMYEKELKRLDSEKKQEVLDNLARRLNSIIVLDSQLEKTKSELKNFAFKHDSEPNILDKLGKQMLGLRDEMQKEIMDLEEYLAKEMNYKPKFSRSRSCNSPFREDWSKH